MHIQMRPTIWPFYFQVLLSFVKVGVTKMFVCFRPGSWFVGLESDLPWVIIALHLHMYIFYYTACVLYKGHLHLD